MSGSLPLDWFLVLAFLEILSVGDKVVTPASSDCWNERVSVADAVSFIESQSPSVMLPATHCSGHHLELKSTCAGFRLL